LTTRLLQTPSLHDGSQSRILASKKPKILDNWLTWASTKQGSCTAPVLAVQSQRQFLCKARPTDAESPGVGDPAGVWSETDGRRTAHWPRFCAIRRLMTHNLRGYNSNGTVGILGWSDPGAAAGSPRRVAAPYIYTDTISLEMVCPTWRRAETWLPIPRNFHPDSSHAQRWSNRPAKHRWQRRASMTRD
jgi:hypothetical protein